MDLDSSRWLVSHESGLCILAQGGFGPAELMFLATIAATMIPIAFVYAIVRLGRGQGTLVIRKFSLSTKPRYSPTPTVEILGRMEGLLAFLLSLLGFSPTVRFTIGGDEIRCQAISLFGEKLICMPLRCVQTVCAGVHRPIVNLVLAAFFLFGGLFLSFAARSWIPLPFGLLVAAVLFIFYFLTKKFFVEIHAANGPSISLLFKPNVLEGVPMDVNKAMDVIGVIRDLVLQQGSMNLAPVANSGLPTEEPSALGSPPLMPLAEPLVPINDEAAYEEHAKEMYAEARSLVDSGDRQNAIAILKEIVHLYPMTSYAYKARKNLEKSGIQVDG